MRRGRPRLPLVTLLPLLLASCGDPTGLGPQFGSVRLVADPVAIESGVVAALAKAFRAETGIEVAVRADRGETPDGSSARDADLLLLSDESGFPARDVAAHAEAFWRPAQGAAPSEGGKSARERWTVFLVRRVPGASAPYEPSRRFYDWLVGPRAREVVRAQRSPKGRTFFLPEEGP